MRIVALIPARAGSKRVPHKNVRLLGGKPLIQWTIEAARESGVFGRHGIIVSTDDTAIFNCATDAGVCALLRSGIADDSQPDIVWVSEALRGADADAFAILRPTSPFRTAGSIRDAWAYFQAHQPADSLRAVRFVREPPQKMWVLGFGGRMTPVLPFYHPRTACGAPVPWHSSPTQSLPAFVVQSAALEIAWTKTVTKQQSISGTSVLSYFLDESEDLDINTEADWVRAEHLMAHLQAQAAAE